MRSFPEKVSPEKGRTPGMKAADAGPAVRATDVVVGVFGSSRCDFCFSVKSNTTISPE